MIELHAKNYKIVTNIHDAVICQVSEDEAVASAKAIQDIAENIVPLSVPLKAEVKLLTSFHEEDKLKLIGGNK